jgi:ankyrin repeat protein
MNILPPTDWSRHSFHVAAMSANLIEIEAQLTHGADINENVAGVGTPLHLAVVQCEGICYPYEKVVELLLERGADVNIRKAGSGTPLHEAARVGNVDIAEMLVAHGADVNSKNEDHWRTPLHYAASGRDEDMIEYLISVGAEVDAVADMPDEDKQFSARRFRDWGMTPMHVATREGNEQVVRCLLAAGASINKKVVRPAPHYDFDGATAFDLVVARRNGLVEQLREIDSLLQVLGSDGGKGPLPLRYSEREGALFLWWARLKRRFFKDLTSHTSSEGNR